MHVLIVGVKGMLGSELFEILTPEYSVTGLGHHEIDISDFQGTACMIKKAQPDIVINCAAYMDVDGCESNPERAFAVNGTGVENLALACRETGSALLQVSTDYIFDGAGSTPYAEDDPPNPRSIYGKSKLAGEEYARSILTKHFIVRTSWLFGKYAGNFVSAILRQAGEKNELAVVYDQVGCPTYTKDLALAIAELIKTKEYGTYHITNSSQCSRYQFAVDILNAAGITGVKVKPIATALTDRPAPRPAYSVLSNRKWRAAGHAPLRPYQQALAEYLRTMIKGGLNI